MRARLIVNPTATGVTPALIERVAAALAPVCQVERIATQRPGHARELAAESGCDLVVAMGGDGTANEVANGLPSGVPAGFLPAGASSVFARQLGFPHHPLKAARLLAGAIAADSVRPVGLGELDGRLFTFAAGIGLDAEAIRRVEQARTRRGGRGRPGDLRVVAAALAGLARDGFTLPERMTVAGAGGRVRAGYLAVANQHPYTYFGRLAVRVAPRASFATGLDVVAVAALRRRDLWRLPVYALLWPRHATAGDSRVAYLHDVDLVEVTCDRPLPAQIDGEYLGLVERCRIAYRPGAISVFVPPVASGPGREPAAADR